MQEINQKYLSLSTDGFMARIIECVYGDKDELMLVSADDAKFLWDHGCFGRSPAKDECPNPVFGAISVMEAFHLLRRTEAGDAMLALRVLCKDVAVSSRRFLEVLDTHGGRGMRHRTLAYDALRRKGWIVHSGLNYGTDFLLYTRGPEEEHAPFAVAIKCEREGCTWREAAALNRVASTAKKRLIIAFVGDAAEAHEDHKACEDHKDCEDPVAGFHIRFLSVSRWIPEMDRTK